MLIVVLDLIFIHRVSALLSSFMHGSSDVMLDMSFLTRIPIPPPVFVVLFFPIHLYPGIIIVSLSFKWVSVMAAMCVPCRCSAEVKLSILLLTPRVLIVSNLRSLSVLIVPCLLPLLVLFLVLLLLVGADISAGAVVSASENLTCLMVFTLPVLVFRMPFILFLLTSFGFSAMFSCLCP